VRAHVGEQQAVGHEDRNEDGGRTRQCSAGTTRAENSSRSARAKARARLGAFATLKQYQANDGEAREDLDDCQNRSQHKFNLLVVPS
jgi:hypothetical protein